MGNAEINFDDQLIGLAATSEENCAPYSGEADHFTAIEYNPQLLSIAEDVYKVRRKRDAQFEKFFGAGLFCDPAWDILLDLYINNGRKRPISVSSACLAAAVPTTTALRYITELVRRQLVRRSPHPDDRRASVLHLTAEVVIAMEGLLHQHVRTS